MALPAMLAKHHLQDKRDLTIIEVRFPDQKAMLKEGKVDLITAVPPFGAIPNSCRSRALSSPRTRQWARSARLVVDEVGDQVEGPKGVRRGRVPGDKGVGLSLEPVERD